MKTELKPLDSQVLSGDPLTIAEAKQFIVDAKKKQEDFRTIAERSWNEIEKRNKLGKLYGGNDLDRAKRWAKFPLWWSCWKIRQPITLARLPRPVLKDTQGDDPVGRTACVVGERLTNGILKTFDAFSEFSRSNDDFLVTNLGWGRWCYKSEQVLEPEKVRVQMLPPPEMAPDSPEAEGYSLQPMFQTETGELVNPELVKQDDRGLYVETGQQVSIKDEMVNFEHGFCLNLLVDPDAAKWSEVTRLAFEYHYSYRAFKEKFGADALIKLTDSNIEDLRSGKKPIIVYEYHDKILKQVRWFAETSEDFFAPQGMPQPSVETDQVDDVEAIPSPYTDIYGLPGFYPCTEPLLINQSTRLFYPTPEYFQVQDILDDISSIVTRMIQLTKAVRIRFLFDSSIRELKTLIGENWASGEGTGMGIPNLQQSLMGGGGSLAALVVYFPIDELMKGLQNMYVAFNQRLEMFYNITGFSNLIRGETNETQRTYGEAQLEGKFAMNRMEPYQRAVQQWLRENFKLGMEMALALFSDETIDTYTMPQTLDPEDQQRYPAALELLRNNRRGRFHFEFETDSTISINQEWRKTKAIETANAITKMLEATAATSQNMPELAEAELKIMKHVVGELTDGKVFMDEILGAIESTIEKVSQPKEPEPNIEMEKLKLEGRKQMFLESRAATEDQLTILQAQMEDRLEAAKFAQQDKLAMLESQLKQYQMAMDAQLENSKLLSENAQFREKMEQEYQKISADVAATQAELGLKRDQLLLELRAIADKKEVEEAKIVLDARIAQVEERLAATQQALDERYRQIEMAEKIATEARLQAEHNLQIGSAKLEALEKVVDISLKTREESPKIEEPKKPRRKISKVIRNKNNDIEQIISEESD